MAWYNNPVVISTVLTLSGAALSYLSSLNATTSALVGGLIFVFTEIHWWASENSPSSVTTSPAPAQLPAPQPAPSGSTSSAPKTPMMTYNGVSMPIGYIVAADGVKTPNIPDGSVVTLSNNPQFPYNVKIPSGQVLPMQSDPRAVTYE